MSPTKPAFPKPLPSEFRTSRRSFLGGAVAGALVAPGSLGLVSRAFAAQDEAGEGVETYPRHGSRTASPSTEISFRGVTPDEVGPIFVVGSFSGGHAGILEPHADGNGFSFLPDFHFEPGEQVRVNAEMPLGPNGQEELTFHVVRPARLRESPANRTADDPEVAPQSFRSRPDLSPPTVEVTIPADGTAPGYIFLGVRHEDGQNGGMIVDNAGDLIWYDPPPVSDYYYHDFRVQEYQGQPVLTWSEAGQPIGYGQGHFVIADTSYERIAEFQVGNGFTGGGDLHEFILTPRGTALIIIYHGVDWDLSPSGGSIYGSAIDGIVQELEIESGRVLFEWHSLDHISVDESYIALPTNRDPFDYLHMNSVEEDSDGNFLISARHTFAVYKIDRQTGQIIWRLNGKQSDFDMGEGTEFAWAHDARVHPNGELTLFDNGEGNQGLEDTEYSRGIVLDLDEDAMTATLLREYIHPDELLASSQANMQVLPNGNVFIGWGNQRDFSEYTSDGEIIFNARFPEGVNSYRAYRAEWDGQPIDPPDLAVELNDQGGATVYASWNGATEVASWQVIAGPTPETMEVVGAAEKDGFETAIAVEVVTDYYAVQAIDAAGTIIGTAIAIQPDA